MTEKEQQEEKSNAARIALLVMEITKLVGAEKRPVSLNAVMVAYVTLHATYGYERGDAHALLDEIWDIYGDLRISPEGLKPTKPAN